MSLPKLLTAVVCLVLSPAHAAVPAASGAKPLACPTPTVAAPAKVGPEVRGAAQRGLEYLSRSSKEWTRQHRCFGCHVQAVTLEGLTVGKHHQYEIAPQEIQAMVDALLLGVTAGGRITGAAFQGQAWARYDQWIDGRRTSQLLQYAEELMRYQRPGGSVLDDDARKPVTGGTMHTTYQAMQTWRQAYARTANDKWLTPIRKAEGFLSAQSSGWNAESGVYLQDVNFALLGLVAAGVGPAEQSSLRLQRLLLSRQNRDGGWGLEKGRSDAFGTGQTLYALKQAGHSDQEPVISRGMSWLVEHQGKDGAWRTVKSGQDGAEKGEGMWAVLGLVTVDVISVAVQGVTDGQHVTETMRLEVEARENQSGGVSKVELLVDDLPLQEACGSKLAHAWSTRGLSEGKHIVDVVVTNARGQQSRRRFEVYAGNVFLTEVGSRFDEARQATEVTVRNLASTAEEAGRVELAVYVLQGKDNKPGKKVYSTEQRGAPGAMAFSWSGAGSDGKALPRGRYLAELVMRDAQGKVVQKESTLVFHDTEAVQRASFGEIEGQLTMKGGTGISANELVELLDEQGRVLQQVRSTAQGNYRFKNVSAGTFKVRAKKEGFGLEEREVSSAPASTAKADMAH